MLSGPTSSGTCDGMVIVHDDRTFTCSNGDCTVTTPAEALISTHSRFFACRSVFTESGCPRCGWHLFVSTVDEETGASLPLGALDR